MCFSSMQSKKDSNPHVLHDEKKAHSTKSMTTKSDTDANDPNQSYFFIVLFQLTFEIYLCLHFTFFFRALN